MKLVYTGPVKELGFKLPVSGGRVVVRPDLPFEVSEADGAALLRKYGDVLVEKPARSSKPPKPAEKPGEPDGTDTE